MSSEAFDRLFAKFVEAGHEAPRRAANELSAVPDGEILAQRVLAGEPLFRVLGWREFHGLKLSLGIDTLEPRDDSETLIDAVLATLPEKKKVLRFADLGTGTGAIGLALLAELPNATVTATDISPGALDIAHANAVTHGLADRFEHKAGSWAQPLDGYYDFIVSNPPYIASAVVDGLDFSVVDFDPRRALDGGEDGLAAYRAIFDSVAPYIRQDGFLALEIGFDQAESVTELAETGGWKRLSMHRDLGGRDRVLVFSTPVL